MRKRDKIEHMKRANILFEERNDDNVRSKELRKLTNNEKMRIFDSAKQKGLRDKFFDFNQDSSLRYISNYGKGYQYWIPVNRETIHNLEVPEDAHIANIIGNMNYTDADKKREMFHNQNNMN